MNDTKEIVRVLRVLEYVGERQWVESQVSNSIHGVKKVTGPKGTGEIRAFTVSEFPETVGEMDLTLFERMAYERGLQDRSTAWRDPLTGEQLSFPPKTIRHLGEESG